MSRYSFAGVELTPETIRAANQWFIDNARLCIAEAVSGRTRVNDLADYTAWREGHIAEWEAHIAAGTCSVSFAFLQRAHFIQTGGSVPILTR